MAWLARLMGGMAGTRLRPTDDYDDRWPVTPRQKITARNDPPAPKLTTGTTMAAHLGRLSWSRAGRTWGLIEGPRTHT